MRTPIRHLLSLWIFSFQLAAWLPAQTNTAAASLKTNALIVIKSTVEVARAGTEIWRPGELNQPLHPGDRIRTGQRSFAKVYLAIGMTKDLSEFSELEVPPSPGVTFKKGLFKIFNREKTKTSRFNLQGATAAIRGTDFLVRVADNGETELTVLDGEVLVANASGEVSLTNGQRGIVAPGVAPRRTAVVEAVNDLIQWSLYYPAVLDVDELEFSREERQALSASLASYRAGDLLAAVGQYSWEREPASEAERSYRAALLLAVGRVDEVQSLLKNLPADSSASSALKEVIAAVKFQSWESVRPPDSSAEWLAESYYEQSRSRLPEALAAARAAAQQSPQFGFAWARVAELEFSFGRTAKALEALERSLQLSPNNASAIALNGFLLAAQNKTSAAISKFDQAITIDSALGNAWLGRGLCLIRRGHSEEGLRDLLVAASLESQRSILRSYLGKAFADAGQEQRAGKELALAKQLDPNDPTSWLYSALFNQEQRRYNEAIRDLEKSLELNNNRRIYRSEFLLDQDRAVRSSSLANLYQSAGMEDVSVREAARAVSSDYANYSAHLFLSDSFNALRDPTRFNLRYETPWFNELLLANLLAPVGGTPLSQNISQQEYSRLFDQDLIGLSSWTEYRSDGQFRELASQYGTIGNTGWALDLDYQHNDGVRPNNELHRIEWYSTIKQQITAQDSVLLLTKYQDYHSGDNFQYYDPANARPDFKFDEFQHPIVVAGYQHEWQPGVQTLLLGGRLANEQRFSDRGAGQLLLIENGLGELVATDGQPFDISLNSDLEIYTAELNQIFQTEHVTVVAGALAQGGQIESSSLLAKPPSGVAPLFGNPAALGSFTEDFERWKGYGYLTFSPINHVWLTGGIAYDQVTMPSNFRHPPLSAGEETRNLWEPKAALVWSPLSQVTMRGVYTRSLGGVSLDESFRLEPTQLAGFPQAFRTVISESIAGSVSAPEFETSGLALDLKLGNRAYAGIQAERIESTVRREIGVFKLDNALAPFIPSTTREHLDYVEHSLAVTVNQLVGDEFAVGLQYRFTDAELHTRLPDVPVSVLTTADRTESSDLHQLRAYALWNHASGWFAGAEANWYHQQNFGYAPAQPGDDFVQLNLFAGYRLPRRKVEVTVGILNLTDQDYRLNPLILYSELPRERVFFARFSFRF